MAESNDELPPGFHWEYYDGDDGGGSYSLKDGKVSSESWPSTRYRRMVGPWVVVSRGGRQAV